MQGRSVSPILVPPFRPDWAPRVMSSVQDVPPRLVIQDRNEVFKFHYIAPLFDTPGLWAALKKPPAQRDRDEREVVQTWLSHQKTESLLHRLSHRSHVALAAQSLEMIVLPPFAMGAWLACVRAAGPAPCPR